MRIVDVLRQLATAEAYCVRRAHGHSLEAVGYAGTIPVPSRVDARSCHPAARALPSRAVTTAEAVQAGRRYRYGCAAAAPIMVRGRPWGTLGIAFADEQRLRPEVVELVRLAGLLAGVALSMDREERTAARHVMQAQRRRRRSVRSG
ncbi:MAG: GAF domain-containing protein [Firmicutes bacterium]|nr:GAF domain-containing protein [Bacillota bacterium]